MKNKIISLGLLATLICTSMPVYGYTDSVGTVDETQTIQSNEAAQCEIYAEVGSEFTVTIPKQITLDGESKTGTYTISCKGDIAGDEYVSVIPDASFTMSQQGKADATANITQAKRQFRTNRYGAALLDTEVLMNDASGANGTTISGTIEASALTAGAWNGVFNFTIALTQEESTNGASTVSDDNSGSDGGSDDTGSGDTSSNDTGA